MGVVEFSAKVTGPGQGEKASDGAQLDPLGLWSFKNTVLKKVMKGDVSRVPKQNKSCKSRN